jgi:hypothetical protein
LNFYEEDLFTTDTLELECWDWGTTLRGNLQKPVFQSTSIGEGQYNPFMDLFFLRIIGFSGGLLSPFRAFRTEHEQKEYQTDEYHPAENYHGDRKLEVPPKVLGELCCIGRWREIRDVAVRQRDIGDGVVDGRDGRKEGGEQPREGKTLDDI